MYIFIEKIINRNKRVEEDYNIKAGTIITDWPKERINEKMDYVYRNPDVLSTTAVSLSLFEKERVFSKERGCVKLARSDNRWDQRGSINVDTLFGTWFTDLTPFRLRSFSSRHPFRIVISRYSNTRYTRPRDFTTSRHTQREMHNGIDLSYCYKRIASPIDKLINELLERRAYYCRCPRLKLVIAISVAVFRSGQTIGIARSRNRFCTTSSIPFENSVLESPFPSILFISIERRARISLLRFRKEKERTFLYR